MSFRSKALSSVLALLLSIGLDGAGNTVQAKNNVPIKLEAKDGSTRLTGNLLRIENDHYVIDTSLFGIMRVHVTSFVCASYACPDFSLVAKASDTPPPATRKTKPLTTSAPNSQTERLLSLIAVAEATHRGYDTVQLRARVPPPAPPTQMTLGEIKAWVRATPRQQHAIGRYQFIPPTFNALQRRLGLPNDTRFSPEVQDRMAYLLLQDAGYYDFLSGRKNPNSFMDSLAAIWAGLPLQSGRSKYHGYAGNKASISRTFFADNVSDIFRNVGSIRVSTDG